MGRESNPSSNRLSSTTPLRIFLSASRLFQQIDFFISEITDYTFYQTIWLEQTEGKSFKRMTYNSDRVDKELLIK